MWVHCFAWVLSSYRKSPVEALSLAQCLGHLVEVAPCKRRSRTCREQGWAQTCTVSSVAQLVLPLGRKPWAGREPCCDFGFILLFYFCKGIKSAGLEMQGLSSTRFTSSPGSPNAACSRSLSQASTSSSQVVHHVRNPKSLQKWLSKTPSFCS